MTMLDSIATIPVILAVAFVAYLFRDESYRKRIERGDWR